MSVFIIAEAGVNHNGRLDTACLLVDAAVDAGADAVKFQAFTPEKLQPMDHAKRAMLKGLALTAQELEYLKRYCDEANIEFMCTAFDKHWLSLLVGLGIERVKIGSGQIAYDDLLDTARATKLPVIISLGMAGVNAGDWQNLVRRGFDDLTLLYCVSQYPTAPTDINLSVMDAIHASTAVKVGFSSHCPSPWPSIAAAYAGAVVLENHITLDRLAAGPDHTSSLTPEEFKVLVREARRVDD